MDAETAIWLGDLIAQATLALEDGPCVTIEVEGQSNHWIQVIPEEAEEKLSGFLLNFPYRSRQGDPLETLQAAGLALPPGTQTRFWEDNGYAALWIRPDVPLVGLAHFAGNVLTHIVGAPSDAELEVQIEYGF